MNHKYDSKTFGFFDRMNGEGIEERNMPEYCEMSMGQRISSKMVLLVQRLSCFLFGIIRQVILLNL